MLNVETKPNQKTMYEITLICNCCTQYSVKTEYLMNDLQKKEKINVYSIGFAPLILEIPFLVVTEFVYALKFCFTDTLFSLPSTFKFCLTV